VNPFFARCERGEFLYEWRELKGGVSTDKKAIHLIPWEPLASADVVVPCGLASILQHESDGQIALLADPFAYIMQITHNRHGGGRAIPLKFIRNEARFEEVE
jgi:hypothetical protein